jgi:hypothetical protein
VRRVLWISVLCLSLAGCDFVHGELDHKPGQDSKIEEQVKAVAPVLGPWGTLAIAIATAATAVFGGYHAMQANQNTKEEKVG